MDDKDVTRVRGHLETVAEKAFLHTEFLKDAGVQARQGSFYTPLDVVEGLLSLSLGPRLENMGKDHPLPTVIDPACGTGNFLVVAALQIRDRLVQLGMTTEDAIDAAVSRCVHGVDVDGEATATCRDSLSMLTSGRVRAADLGHKIVHANSLTLPFGGDLNKGQLDLFADSGDSWARLFPEVLGGPRPGFDVVIGNPPFLNQLESDTVMDSNELRAVRDNFGSIVGKMTNPATVFLLIGQRLVSAEGSLLMIQPLSFFATAHSAAARRLLSSTGRVSELWVCLEKIFDASVQVAAVHVDLSRAESQVSVLAGREFTSMGAIDKGEINGDTWSIVLARAQGYPVVNLDECVQLETIASASAAFRDQYYGLVGAVTESGAAEGPVMRLATVGLVDPATFRWGETPTRFAKTVYVSPTVVLGNLEESLGQWAESLRLPKVMVATQTKVIEVLVDETGDVLPSVPLITVRCSEDDLWKVASMLSAPPVSLLAAQRHLGAGMSSDALRVTAKELLALPLPVAEEYWLQGADFFHKAQHEDDENKRRELLLRMGQSMCYAYGIEGNEVFDWWASRLPQRSEGSE